MTLEASDTEPVDPNTESNLFQRAQRRVAHALNIRYSDVDWQAFNVRGGLPSHALDTLASWGAHPDELRWVAGSKDQGPYPDTQLSAAQTHRWLQLGWVFALAIEVLGDKALAANWLYKTRPPGTSRHIDSLINGGGVNEIESLLVRIDSGYSL